MHFVSLDTLIRPETRKKPFINAARFVRQENFLTAVAACNGYYSDKCELWIGTAKCNESLDEFNLTEGKKLALKRLQRVPGVTISKAQLKGLPLAGDEQH